MPEPTSTTAAAAAIVGGTALLLEVTGVDLPPFVWSSIGAAFMQAYSPAPTGRWRALAQVLLSGLLGAILGLGLGALTGASNRHLLLMLCAIGGAGAWPVTQALISRAVKQAQG